MGRVSKQAKARCRTCLTSSADTFLRSDVIEESCMPAEKFSLANSKAFVGQELGVSGWITLNQQRIDQFAECTEDHQWIHVDIERAKRDSPLGTTIAHGYLTLAMLAPSYIRDRRQACRDQPGAELRPRPRALHRAGQGRFPRPQSHQAARRGGQGRGANPTDDRKHHRDRRRSQASPYRPCACHGD